MGQWNGIGWRVSLMLTGSLTEAVREGDSHRVLGAGQLLLASEQAISRAEVDQDDGGQVLARDVGMLSAG